MPVDAGRPRPRRALTKRAVPRIMRTPWLSSSCVTPACRCDLMSSIRAVSASVSTSGVGLLEAHPRRAAQEASSPRRWRSSSSTGCSPSRWAAPPITSRSIIVTSAPKRCGVRGGRVAGRATADDHEARGHRRPGVRHSARTRAAGASEATPTIPSRYRRPTMTEVDRRTPRRTPSRRTDAAAGSPPNGRAARRQVDAIRAAGVEPYPYRFDRTHSSAEVRASWPTCEPGHARPTDEVSVAGRVLAQARHRQADLRHDRRPRRRDPAVRLQGRHRRRRRSPPSRRSTAATGSASTAR